MKKALETQICIKGFKHMLYYISFRSFYFITDWILAKMKISEYKIIPLVSTLSLLIGLFKLGSLHQLSYNIVGNSTFSVINKHINTKGRVHYIFHGKNWTSLNFGLGTVNFRELENWKSLEVVSFFCLI